MNNKFKEFYTYSRTDENFLEKIWKNKKETLFIFDTNTLLDLYRYAEGTRAEFFKNLNKVKQQIWLPYHVGLEFHNNRIKVIIKNKRNIDSYFKRLDLFDSLIVFNNESYSNILKDIKKEEFPELYSKLAELKVSLTAKVEDTKKELIQETKKELESLIESQKLQFQLTGTDQIQEKLSEYFNDNCIGDNLFSSQKDIEDLFHNAKNVRWPNEIPPGYVDFSDKGEQCFYYNGLKYYNALGDLIIFREIIELCKKNLEVKNIFFISNDGKKDWKLIDDYQGQKDLGARPELRRELFNEANHIQQFEILSITEFLKNTAKFNNSTITDSTLDDITKKNKEKIKLIEINDPLADSAINNDWEVRSWKPKKRGMTIKNSRLQNQIDKNISINENLYWESDQSTKTKHALRAEKDQSYKDWLLHRISILNNQVDEFNMIINNINEAIILMTRRRNAIFESEEKVSESDIDFLIRYDQLMEDQQNIQFKKEKLTEELQYLQHEIHSL